jgi:hypothetical protein
MFDEKQKSELRATLVRALAIIDGVSGAASQRGPSGNAGLVVADDADLDGKFGDPPVRFAPRRFAGGEQYVGRTYSECPSDFLDALAEALEWSANNPKPGKDPKYSDYDRKDAARARGWSRRNANGVKRRSGGVDREEMPEPNDFGGSEDSSDLPF